MEANVILDKIRMILATKDISAEVKVAWIREVISNG